jgi:type IV pilus assembly protein PilM
MKFSENIKSFFKDITNFFQTGSVLGIDIGTSSIKVVELSEKGGRFNLENYGILETRDYLDHGNLAIQMSSLQVVESEAARLLQMLLKEAKVKSQVALISIPEFASFVTLLDMPLISNKETSQSVEFQAKKYIPMPVGEVQIDWQKVDEYENKDGQKFQRLLLIGIPKKVISSYKNICKQAGLRAVSMELESMSLVRALPKFERPTLIVDIGAESTTSLVTEGGVVKYSNQADYGGINITRAISTSLDLGMQRGEELKKRRGLLGEAGGSELSTLMLPFLDVIIQEVDYIRDIYERRYGKKVVQFAVVGGGANLSGIEDYFKDQLGINSVKPNIFGDIIYPPNIASAIKELGREMPISIGVAKKYFIQ